MLNPHEPVDSQPELRYTNKDGLGAVHLAVIRDRFDILKILLKTDQTLLCMPTENDDQSFIIHQAVTCNNPTIIRYLLGNPAYFRLFKEQKENSKNRNLGANNQRQANPYEKQDFNLLETEDKMRGDSSLSQS